MVNAPEGNKSAGFLTNNMNLEQENSLNFSESNIIGAMEENSKDSAINAFGDNLDLNLREERKEDKKNENKEMEEYGSDSADYRKKNELEKNNPNLNSINIKGKKSFLIKL